MYVGMPVYLCKNMAVELGLTNGTAGIIKSIHLRNANVTEDTGVHRVDFDKETDYIIVEFDDISMMAPLPGLLPNQIPITVMSGNFRVNYPKGQKYKNGKLKMVSVKIEHFPIVPRFGITAHKSQGMTLDKVVVDLNPIFKKKSPKINFAYVPLSRVRRLSDLSILRSFPLEVLKAKVNPCCAAMMEEFRQRDLCKDM